MRRYIAMSYYEEAQNASVRHKSFRQHLQLDFCFFEFFLGGSGKILSRPVDIEGKHRHGRALRARFSSLAACGRISDGTRDFLWVILLENIFSKSIALLHRVTSADHFSFV